MRLCLQLAQLHHQAGFGNRLSKRRVLDGGGDRFQAHFDRLIDRISVVNSECEWTFTTNAHWVLNDKIKESLDQIRVKHISVSIDSLLPDIDRISASSNKSAKISAQIGAIIPKLVKSSFRKQQKTLRSHKPCSS